MNITPGARHPGSPEGAGSPRPGSAPL